MLKQWKFKPFLTDPGSNLFEFYNYPAWAPSATSDFPKKNIFLFSIVIVSFLNNSLKGKQIKSNPNERNQFWKFKIEDASRQVGGALR
jgi:hypothetical protein